MTNVSACNCQRLIRVTTKANQKTVCLRYVPQKPAACICTTENSRPTRQEGKQ